jgi:hypothetical protein
MQNCPKRATKHSKQGKPTRGLKKSKASKLIHYKAAYTFLQNLFHAILGGWKMPNNFPSSKGNE